MERETLLTILLLLLGGLAVQLRAFLPSRPLREEAPSLAERRAWVQLWLPLLPALVVAAWLCGWAIREPDPVQERLGPAMLIAACLPFAALAARASIRAVWALVRAPELPVCTVGLLRPRIVFSPFLARTLDEGPMRAAWEHEQAHVRHRDPLRIWLAQIATDLQWPCPGAADRFDAWLGLLECARDDEARRCGASGVDLAAAVLETARWSSLPSRPRAARFAGADATLIGAAPLLQRRIARLLSPLSDGAGTQVRAALDVRAALALAAGTLGIAVVLGAAYGERVLHPLLAWTWTA